MMRLAAIVVGMAACAAPARIETSDPCELATVDTAGWQPLTTHQGTFALSLPTGAVLVRLPCIDSPCGEIRTGTMVISYDSGPMAGPGTELTPLRGVVIDRSCRVRTSAGRSWLVGLGRYRATVPMWGPAIGKPDTIHAGSVAAQAVMPLTPDSGGLYLYMRSEDPADLARFVTAVRTVRVLPAAGRAR